MDNLFAVLLFFSFVALVIGLFRPQWVRMSSRKMAGKVFGGAAIIFFILFGITSPDLPESSTAANIAPIAQEVADTSNTSAKPDTGANSATQGQSTGAQEVPVPQPAVKPASTPAQAQQPAPAPTVSSETVSQKNAVRKAIAYLGYSAYSRDGLIAQLEYEQFSHADAVYGADNAGANWNEQAAKKARQYMDYSAYSRGGLIEQLMYEKFTQAQAEYGANAVGL